MSRKPNRLANLLLPKTAEHKRRISEGLRRYQQRVREALAAQEQGHAAGE